jgi:hypothetical protein
MSATNHANSADLTAALHGIIAEGRAKKDEHAASLRKYEINDDEDVPEHLYRRYDEVRTTNALDAAEFLDYPLTRLAELVRADTATADDLGDPVPGTEYAYPLSDYAYEAARVLCEGSGEEWTTRPAWASWW